MAFNLQKTSSCLELLQAFPNLLQTSAAPASSPAMLYNHVRLGSSPNKKFVTPAGSLVRVMGARSALLPAVLARSMTTSAQYVAARHIDPTFEKLMDGYKHLLKVVAVQDLILASPGLSLPLPLLFAATPKLGLNRGAPHFVRTFPRIFSLHYDPSSSQALVRLSPSAAQIALQESSATGPAAVDRLSRLLSMSPSRSLPLRAIFRIWKELGLPDDFEDSIIVRNPTIFLLQDNPQEPNTHLLKLVGGNPNPNFTPAVEEWRCRERSREGSKVDEMELRFGFKHGFPPGMRLTKNFRTKVKDWQQLPYVGPYDAIGDCGGCRGKRSKDRMKRMEKRAVGITHEFLSLTVEKMVEVEKISHFRKWFGIELNIRDMFLDHPGIFYLSTKGKRHTVFLREAYDRGRLIDPNPIYEARRRLLELVLMRRRGSEGGQLGVEEEAGQEEQEESGSAADNV